MIVLLAVSSPLAAQSQTLDLFFRIPWSLGIHLIKLINREEKKILYIEVTAAGKDFEAARESAFRMAVERSVGVIVSSESTAHNQQLTRDEIITYASGFVSDYKLVDQTQIGNQIWVKMQVWVSHSHLRDRLLSQSRQSGHVEGGRISAQIQSFQLSRQNGDRILNSVLNDYPQRAFDITLGHTQVLVNSARQMILQVPVSVAWSPHYIRSLKSAIQAINQRPDCARWAVFCSNLTQGIYIDDVVAFFEDAAAGHAFYQNMIISAPQLELTIFDVQGRPALKQFFTHPALSQGSSWPQLMVDFHPTVVPGYHQSRPTDRLRINTDVNLKLNLQVPLMNLDVKNLDKVEVKIVRKNI